jgi:hypothetical protein
MEPLSGADAAAGGTAARDLSSASTLRVFGVNGRPYGVRTPVHVLTLSGPNYSLKVGLAHGAIDAGRQAPAAICRATLSCVAAVNGDFFNLTRRGTPDPGDSVGGIIQDCALLHTPEVAHQYANLAAATVSGGLNWGATLAVNGVSLAITAVNQQLPLRYPGVHLPLTGTLLFTPAYALATPSAPGWVTYQFTQVDPTVSPTALNSTAQLSFVGSTTYPLRVSTGQVDISAPSSVTLSALQVGDTVTLTTTSTAGCDTLGGHPILINQGVVTPVDPADVYMAKPYARTVVGWTAAGDTVLLVVDGRDGVSGATAHQLVRLLQSLNVVTALNLDGGMSTTFYALGRVRENRGHGPPRHVSTALLVVQRP